MNKGGKGSFESCKVLKFDQVDDSCMNKPESVDENGK